MDSSAFLRRVGLILLAAAAMCVWTLAAMVYFDRFAPPFDFLASLLMPWKALDRIPADAVLTDRLARMQQILDESSRMSGNAFLLMIISLSAVIISLTVVYQQTQRRGRENELLILKNSEIARRNEFIRFISATISHEFKNNLGRIKRRIDLLPDLPPVSRERIEDNMEKLFADIDIFKRISDEREAGLGEFSRLDLRALIEGIARSHGDLADIRIHAADPVHPIYASETLLRSVFETVLDNAIKYRKPAQEKARIIITMFRDTDGNRSYVTVSVRDEGIGMDDRHADACFYKNRRTGENWGQGLYFAKYVIGLHAGKIRIGREHTAPGTGTEVIIKFPFVEEAAGV